MINLRFIILIISCRFFIPLTATLKSAQSSAIWQSVPLSSIQKMGIETDEHTFEQDEEDEDMAKLLLKHIGNEHTGRFASLDNRI